MKPQSFPWIPMAMALTLSSVGVAQQSVTQTPFTVTLETKDKSLAPGKPATLDFYVVDAESKLPSLGLTIAASASMPTMSNMMLAVPSVTPGRTPGHYLVRLAFPASGAIKLELLLKTTTGDEVKAEFNISPASKSDQAMDDMPGMQQSPGMKPMTGMKSMGAMAMKGVLGPWSPNREGSGTSWQTDSAPMFMSMLHPVGGFELSTMGVLQGGYIREGDARGGEGPFSNSMVMLMGRKDVGGGALGIHLMTSLDPLINSRQGVPNLFQNGFTVHGVDINDRKDPHNVFSEVAASYSHSISNNWDAFLYGGPVGEPALGNTMYFHRTSGLEIPEAPISHDWFDGTHISFGVATAGIVYKKKWKAEASVFNGHDPTNLFGIGPLAFNSASGRLTFNPTQDWSFSTSYGYLNADTNDHRLTLSAAYSHQLLHGDVLSATLYFGQNIVRSSATSIAWLAEATYYHANDAFFAPFERVDKGELLNVPLGTYTVNKLLLGDVHTFYSFDNFSLGFGAYAGVYAFPTSLNAFYGTNPLTFGVFFRIRPGKR